ncbi:hypothetical protein SAMN05443661_16312 [Natronobacterium gregoryi]|uniref:Uncharacterized protein n=2 Tax=Natronobacterium gregoryi TaxID=44930 RepID=L0AIY8_NATGS|nr:hypothetical protein Natgr_2719 [Natronobacterium gregoryi SP2]SFJ71250.1 hypothetical protein SAMN05443661_16312 [Natronobacterium gregoryi]
MIGSARRKPAALAVDSSIPIREKRRSVFCRTERRDDRSLCWGRTGGDGCEPAADFVFTVIGYWYLPSGESGGIRIGTRTSALQRANRQYQIGRDDSAGDDGLGSTPASPTSRTACASSGNSSTPESSNRSCLDRERRFFARRERRFVAGHFRGRTRPRQRGRGATVPIASPRRDRRFMDVLLFRRINSLSGVGESPPVVSNPAETRRKANGQ